MRALTESELSEKPDLTPAGRTGLSALEHAVVSTVAYRDVFEFPPTRDEIHRYLHGVSCTPEEIDRVLQSDRLIGRFLSSDGTYYSLLGRENLFETRHHRRTISEALWKKAHFYAGLLASLPFVRMVAVSGSLAADNAADADDIDFFVITDPGHLWRTRLLARALQVISRRMGGGLCCNYFVTLKGLELDDRRLYTAQELAQMVPLYGLEVYDRIRSANQWTADLLPNADGPPSHTRALNPLMPAVKPLLERLFGGSLGTRLERREAHIKIRRYRRRSGRWSRFTRERMGHRLHIGDWIERAHLQQLSRLGLRLE